MLKVTQRYSGTPAAAIIDRLSLPFDLRKRGRFKATAESGREVGIFIERGQVLQDGDLLLTECQQLIQVVAEAEPVVTATASDWLQFSRVCYHLGNRHVPLQVGELWLRFQPDHVLQELAELHGLTAISELAPFMPENGAYGAHGGQGHHSEEPQGHSHEDSQEQGSSHSHDHSHSHSDNNSQDHSSGHHGSH
ncbi:MAG: urease accessory protein UreE, partial [Motiliproteus sp.]